MQIHSSRLHYHPLSPQDWPFFCALNLDPQVMRYVSDPRNEDEIRRQSFDMRLPRWTPGSTHWLCLVMRKKEDDTPVGVTGFIDRGAGVAEVGFLLASAFQGQGYGIESLRALCEAAFSLPNFRKLTATVTAGNLASKALLEKAGFVQEGTLRQSYFLHGRWQDDWVFGLLKAEFRQGSQPQSQ